MRFDETSFVLQFLRTFFGWRESSRLCSHFTTSLGSPVRLGWSADFDDFKEAHCIISSDTSQGALVLIRYHSEKHQRSLPFLPVERLVGWCRLENENALQLLLCPRANTPMLMHRVCVCVCDGSILISQTDTNIHEGSRM